MREKKHSVIEIVTWNVIVCTLGKCVGGGGISDVVMCYHKGNSDKIEINRD